MKSREVRVVFVCTGNICRSPLAEAVFRDEIDKRGMAERFAVDSAGTDAYHAGDQADSRMRRVAKRHGVTLDHRSRQFGRDELSDFDYVFAMDTSHYRTLRRNASSGALAERVVLFRSHDPQTGDRDFPDVPDPWYGGVDGFESVYEIITRTCTRIADDLVARAAAD